MGSAVSWSRINTNPEVGERFTVSPLSVLVNRLKDVSDRENIVGLQAGRAEAFLVPFTLLRDLSLLGPTVQVDCSIPSVEGAVLIAIADEPELLTLFTKVAGGSMGLPLPAFFALPEAKAGVLISWTLKTGRSFAEAGVIRIAGTIFKLFEVSRKPESAKIVSMDVKIGEGADNLAGRTRWFRSRTGR